MTVLKLSAGQTDAKKVVLKVVQFIRNIPWCPSKYTKYAAVIQPFTTCKESTWLRYSELKCTCIVGNTLFLCGYSENVKENEPNIKDLKTLRHRL